jgi:PAS domain S-box-containing protein
MATKTIKSEKSAAPLPPQSRSIQKFASISVWATVGLGLAVITAGVWQALNSKHDNTDNTSAAMYSLLDTGSVLQSDIDRTVRPAMQRTEILAKMPELIQALASGDRAAQTAVLNSKITRSVELDAIALFDSAGGISAINTVYANGKPISSERVSRVMGSDFSGRNIIQSCLRNTSSKSILEFQTHCDITPAFFDSTGLSVAYSVPVIDPQTGAKLGVLSSRLSFDRLSALIEGRTLGGGAATAYFVTDDGSYFSEAINSGKVQPPIPVIELRDIVRPTLGDPASKTITQRAADYLAVFSLPGVQTLGGGGIHILIVADGNWLMKGPRQDRLVRAAGSGLIGTLLLIVAGLAHARLVSHRIRRTIDCANKGNARLAAIVESSSEAIIGDDLDGTIQSWNPGAEKIFGFSASEAIGRNADLIEPADRPGEIAKLRAAVIQGASIEQLEVRRRCKDGREIDISLSTSLIKSTAGEIIGISRIARDISSQKRIESELREAHDQLEARVSERTRELKAAHEVAEAANQAKSIIFDTALDAIVTIDSRSVIKEWNLQAETMFRWDRTEAVGMCLDLTIFPQQQWEAHRLEIEGFAKTGDSPLLNKVAELVAVRRDGKEFPVELAITPSWSGGECTFTAFIRDITVRKQAEADLRQARDAAENASRAKSEFLANMSHEIRTPLNGVIGMSDLLLGTAMDEKQRRFVELIKTSGASLANLINDILDFSKIEARKLEIESVEFDLYSAVEDVMETLLMKATPKGLDLGCLTLPEVPRQVTGDPQRVKQILINLVNNAIKFTESGSISTRLTVDNQTQDCATVRFSVTDTGIGIPADRMDRLFKSFSQVDASTTRSFGGTGLGLAISKQLAELMGGAVGVQSKVGHGSTFWFTVKLGLGPQITEPVVAVDTRGLRVLVVHEDPAMQEILQDQLLSWNLTASVASNGKDAMTVLCDAAAKSEPFDVAIIDGELPDTTALELGNAIKARPEIAAAVLLILLPWGADLDPLKLRKAGFSGHLLKPVRQSRLYNTIMGAMGSTSQTKLICAELAPITAGASGKAAAIASTARILIAEDNRINQIVATEVLSNHGYTCDVVENGTKAVTAVFTGRYNLVLMDCSMPGMDGFEATRQIRQAETADPTIPPRHIPIIALTANAIKGDKDKCLESGMDDYVSKPLDPDRLIEAIRLQLTKSDSISIKPPMSVPALPLPANSSTGGAPMGIEALLQRCMGNAAAAASVLTEFEREAIDDLAQISVCVKDNDCNRLTRAAHSLKGASAILSADTLVGIALKLEQMGRSGVLVEQQQLLDQLNEEVQRCIGYLPTARAAIASATTGNRN